MDPNEDGQDRGPGEHASLNCEISPARSVGTVKGVPTYPWTQHAPVSPTLKVTTRSS